MPKVTLENAQNVIEYHAPGDGGLEKIAAIRKAALAFIECLLNIQADTEGAEGRDWETDEHEAVEDAHQEFVRVILNSAPFCEDRSVAINRATNASIYGVKVKGRDYDVQVAIRLAREAMTVANAAVVLNGLI